MVFSLLKKNQVLQSSFFVCTLFSQSLERGDPTTEDIHQLMLNKVRGSIHNFGSSGGGGAVGFHYEWPTNSDRKVYSISGSLRRYGYSRMNLVKLSRLCNHHHRRTKKVIQRGWSQYPVTCNPNSTKIAIMMMRVLGQVPGQTKYPMKTTLDGVVHGMDTLVQRSV